MSRSLVTALIDAFVETQGVLGVLSIDLFKRTAAYFFSFNPFASRTSVLHAGNKVYNQSLASNGNQKPQSVL